jgi:hypothetical protein
MRRHGGFQFIVLVVCFLSSAGVLFAQRTPKALVVNGKNVSAAVVQINGRSYVDINSLAQAINGSVTFQQDKILLTIPSSEAAGVPPPQITDRISKDFASAGISALADIRAWKDVVVAVMEFGVLLNGPWYQDHHDSADASLKLAAVAVSTTSDQSAFQLLQNEFTNVEQWGGNLVANRQALNATKTMAPNAIRDDPAMAKINDCVKALNPMLASGVYRDVPSCH